MANGSRGMYWEDWQVGQTVVTPEEYAAAILPAVRRTGLTLVMEPGRWIVGPAGQLIMRLTDVFLAVPQLVLALVFASVLKPSVVTAMIALTLTYWPLFCRVLALLFLVWLAAN